MLSRKMVVLVGAVWLAGAAGACEDSGDGGFAPDADADSDSDSDSDTDSDTDIDTDTDTDIDTDADTDTDVDTDTDIDTDTDSDVDTDVDTDTDTDVDSDSDTEVVPECTDADDDGWCIPFDCNDADPDVHPGASEDDTNGYDDDCDGDIDEPPWDEIDLDGDGYTPLDGDCDETSIYINPDAIEDLGEDETGDDIDNDCDGLTDEVETCACGGTGNEITNLVCAMDICIYEWESMFYLGSGMSSPCGVTEGSMLNPATEAVTKFGTPANLDARKGGSYTLLSSGTALQTSGGRTTSLGGSAYTDPFDGTTEYDAVELVLSLRAPSNALGFSFDYIFFSAEYDDYIGTTFNDKFYAIMNGPSTGSVDEVIDFTSCRDLTSGGYYDFIDAAACPTHPFGHCCYLAVNNSYSECCWYGGCPSGTWDFNIAGTGFSCASSSAGDSAATGSSTEWLMTTAAIEPGEEFQLRFHVHDTGDHIYDSEVILDNFRWHAQPVEPGTFPIE